MKGPGSGAVVCVRVQVQASVLYSMQSCCTIHSSNQRLCVHSTGWATGLRTIIRPQPVLTNEINISLFLHMTGLVSSIRLNHLIPFLGPLLDCPGEKCSAHFKILRTGRQTEKVEKQKRERAGMSCLCQSRPSLLVTLAEMQNRWLGQRTLH